MFQVVALLLLFLIGGCATAPADHTRQDMAAARTKLGLEYLLAGERVKARANLIQALNHDPGYVVAQLAMAHYLEVVGEFEQAEVYFRQAVSQHPGDGQVMNNYGVFLCKQKRFEEAEFYFRQAISQADYAMTASSYENAALCALKSGHLQQARHFFHRALAHDPNRLQSGLQLARMDIKEKNWASAATRINQLERHLGHTPLIRTLRQELLQQPPL